MDRETWNACNNVLAHIRDLRVVELVDQHYRKYGNPDPAYCLQQTIDELQEILDKHQDECCISPG